MNAFDYALHEERIMKNQLAQTGEYELQTTFVSDFAIAECFGLKAIDDTYKRAIKEWKTNKVYATELVIILNLRCWLWFQRMNEATEEERGKCETLMETYRQLFYDAEKVVSETLTGGDLEYYYNTID